MMLEIDWLVHRGFPDEPHALTQFRIYFSQVHFREGDLTLKKCLNFSFRLYRHFGHITHRATACTGLFRFNPRIGPNSLQSGAEEVVISDFRTQTRYRHAQSTGLINLDPHRNFLLAHPTFFDPETAGLHRSSPALYRKLPEEYRNARLRYREDHTARWLPEFRKPLERVLDLDQGIKVDESLLSQLVQVGLFNRADNRSWPGIASIVSWFEADDWRETLSDSQLDGTKLGKYFSFLKKARR